MLWGQITYIGVVGRRITYTEWTTVTPFSALNIYTNVPNVRDHAKV